MASSIIHIAVAKKVHEKYKYINNLKDYYLGSVAPDISKQIGSSKEKSHFLTNSNNKIPNINLFTKRYPYFKYNSFDLGYYTHLYTDKEWKEKFIPNVIFKDSIKLLDGTILEATPEEIKDMIYSDYTNLNIKLIEDYDLDLSLFYEDFIIPNTNINEIPINNLDILINKMSILIENSKEEKTYTFDIIPLEEFINNTAELIIKSLENY